MDRDDETSGGGFTAHVLLNMHITCLGGRRLVYAGKKVIYSVIGKVCSWVIISKVPPLQMAAWLTIGSYWHWEGNKLNYSLFSKSWHTLLCHSCQVVAIGERLPSSPVTRPRTHSGRIVVWISREKATRCAESHNTRRSVKGGLQPKAI